MSEFEIELAEDLDDEDYNGELPSGDKEGYIIVRVEHGEVDDDGNILNSINDLYSSKWEYDVIEYDSDSAVFWITEGIGLDYFLDQYVDFPRPGIYKISGITVHWTKDYYGEVDEDWEWKYLEICG